MDKQTSIEWLVEQLKQYDFSEDDGMYFIKIPSWLLKEKKEEAQQMHKEEIVSAYRIGNTDDGCNPKQYYKETYEQSVTNSNELSSPKTSDNCPE